MVNAFFVIFTGMLILGYLERKFPNYSLPTKKGWLLRATLFNMMQLIITALGYYTWEYWFATNSNIFNLKTLVTPFFGGLIAYIINAWIFYWWHRFRHESNLMWLLFHQLHHSPQRIEVITSFYKHPFEVILNSIIITILVYPILGLSVEGNGWLSIFSAFGEFFYHLNIKTPHWIGYILQRPESHVYHHLRDRILCCNYSDFAFIDFLGGTLYNPEPDEKFDAGFSNDTEEDVVSMLICKNVIKNKKLKILLFYFFIGNFNLTQTLYYAIIMS